MSTKLFEFSYEAYIFAYLLDVEDLQGTRCNFLVAMEFLKSWSFL